MQIKKILDQYDDAFRLVPSNIVQAIHAFRPDDLERRAEHLQHHFLYADYSPIVHNPESLPLDFVYLNDMQKVLRMSTKAFCLPDYYSYSFEYLFDSLTELVDKAGHQTGMIVVLDLIPETPTFDNDARESFLDVFRDAAEFWAEKDVPFRAFYSFL